MMHTRQTRRGGRRCTLGADKAYDTHDFVEVTRELGVTPHVTQNTARRGGSAIDGRTTRHAGYAKSQHARPRIEPAFGWLKTIAWFARSSSAGCRRSIGWWSSRVRRSTCAGSPP